MKKQWKWLLTALALVAVLVIAALLYRNLSGRYSSAPTTEAVTQTETVPDEETGAVEETDVSGETAAETEAPAPETESVQAAETTRPETTEPETTKPETTKPQSTTAPPQTTAATTAPAAVPTLASGSVQAADFVVYDRNNAQTRLSDHFGKPVVVNFWATWCGPCRSELPAFDAAAKQYAGSIDFMMINLAENFSDTVDSALNFVSESGYTFPVYFDSDAQAANTYGIYSIPLTLFIRSDGSVMAMHTGSMDQATLQSYLDLLS